MLSWCIIEKWKGGIINSIKGPFDTQQDAINRMADLKALGRGCLYEIRGLVK